MGFNTPLIKISEPDMESENGKEPEYKFADELADCLDDCKKELTEYLNGKVAPDPQGKLFPEAKEEAAKENGTRTRGRKKIPA